MHYDLKLFELAKQNCDKVATIFVNKHTAADTWLTFEKSSTKKL